MAMERRKRSSNEHETCFVGNSGDKKEVLEASYSMLRGFFNALDAHDNICSNYFVCEAAREASKLGEIGQILSKVASSNAQSWLLNVDELKHNGTQIAGETGSFKNQDCLHFYPCYKIHETYKKPYLSNPDFSKYFT